MDLIDRQAAIDAVEHITSSMSVCVNTDECHGMKRMQRQAVIELANLLSVEPEISRIEQELHGKTPEEQYEFIYWLLFKSFEATAYSNSRLAIIEWLRGGKEDG